MLDLPIAAQASLISAARDSRPVRGLTHGYYKYPARFSPSFARAAIESFTRPYEIVLDNHVGGGTTLVEALALGRRAMGVDISQLAQFVTSIKTTVFSSAHLDRLEGWVANINNTIHMRRISREFAEYAELGYYKHLNHPSRWRLRKAIDQALRSAEALEDPRLEAFVRCVVLRTAQWALDGRKTTPTVDLFRTKLAEHAKGMIVGARELSTAVQGHAVQPEIRVINRSAVGLEMERTLADWGPPKLVLTSPPYPGVHVLYHRWQVDGRKEAPLPFLIAKRFDGAGSSYYTMGDRKYPRLRTYFDNIRASMASAATLAGVDTVVVQVIAFSDPSWQLGHYLEAMQEAGLTECFLPLLDPEPDGRLWRSVPGRRWYSDQRGTTPGSQEVVLFHRKRKSSIEPQRPDRTCPEPIRP